VAGTVERRVQSLVQLGERLCPAPFHLAFGYGRRDVGAERGAVSTCTVKVHTESKLCGEESDNGEKEEQPKRIHVADPTPLQVLEAQMPRPRYERPERAPEPPVVFKNRIEKVPDDERQHRAVICC
jgi:hypothetical protein